MPRVEHRTTIVLVIGKAQRSPAIVPRVEHELDLEPRGVRAHRDRFVCGEHEQLRSPTAQRAADVAAEALRLDHVEAGLAVHAPFLAVPA